MMNETKHIGVDDVRSTLKELIDTYQNKVINPPIIKIEDFVKDEFLPKIKTLHTSDVFAQPKSQDDISDIELVVSSMRDRLIKKLGEPEEDNISLELKRLIVKKLRTLNEMLDNLTVSLGMTETHVKTIPEYIPLSKKRSPDYIIAPDSTYTIHRPPLDGWNIRQLSMLDWMAEDMEIKDASYRKMLFQSTAAQMQKVTDSPEILVFDSKNELELLPLPGRTLINGQKIPSALGFSGTTKLSIVPMNRYQPPTFFEGSLVYNFLKTLAPVFSMGVLKLRTLNVSTGITPTKSMESLKAEFYQELNDIIFHDKEISEVFVNFVIFGFEGEIQDYYIIMRYVTIPGIKDEMLENEILTLKSLIESFSPAKIIDRNEKLKSIRDAADQKLKEKLKKGAEEMFYSELAVQFMRLSEIDINDSSQLQKSLQSLKRFESLAKELHVEDEYLDDLWQSIRKAEKGDPSDYIEAFEGYKKDLAYDLLPNADKPITNQLPEFLSHEDIASGIRLKYPSDWHKYEKDSKYIFSSGVYGQEQPANVEVYAEDLSDEEKNLSFVQFTHKVLDDIKLGAPNLEIIDSRLATFGHTLAKKIVYSYTPVEDKLSDNPFLREEKNKSIQAMLVCSLVKNKKYFFIFKVEKYAYNDFLPTLQAILDSTEIIDKT